ncbi:MAG: hypothetical protein A2X46_01910 [Lentisphaerae bacterium GWF2_57_35]|nr:MAG: hypothetical protein A2X46_01910 [Lentisphaerae bacterium GWF2_57_35]
MLPAESTSSAKPLLHVQGGDRYEMKSIIAKGGMGVVREAVDLNCRRIVAIKELSKEHPISSEDLQQFVEEARITSQLEHPNIVPIHELGFDMDQNAFYSMKYVKGITLAEVLRDIRRGRRETIEQYPLPRLLNVFQKVCDAVAFAHSKGIVHCDLKPDNIMICDFGEVMVMDWGIARPVGSMAGIPAPLKTGSGEEKAVKTGQGEEKTIAVEVSSRTVSCTSTGQIMGTPGFIAPERIRPGAVLMPAADIYSLGATLYSILALRAPLAGLDMRTLLLRALTGSIVPPAAYNDPEFKDRDRERDEPISFVHCHEGKIPVALSGIAMKALSVHLEDRYASVQDLQADLEAYQNGRIWNLVLEQDFAGPDPLAQWEILGGHSEIKNDELHLSLGEPQLLLFKGELPGDVRIEFEARQEGVYLNALGAFIGAVRSANPKEMALTGYKFEYGGFDNSLNVIERCARRIAIEHASPLERGVIYNVGVEKNDSRLRMTVNGRDVLSMLDLDPLTGLDRTAIGLCGWLAETIITRIRIYTMGSPWKRDLLDIAESQILKDHYEVADILLKEVLDSSPTPDRLRRAQIVGDLSRQRKSMSKELERWTRTLREAWPHAPFDLRLGNEGFSLEISNGGIDDLEPLRGLPLTSLMCAYNRITSLEPLRGMPLTAFNCTGSKVVDLDPLRGMQLNTFVCENGLIESLEALRGMPLMLVNIGGSRVRSLDPLRNMALTFLSCSGNCLETLEPLDGMKTLSALYCNGNGLETLEPLRGIPLVSINASGNRLLNLEALRGMSLGVLHVGDNLIESLEPLQGMPLRMLSCQNNRIASLEPLRGLNLGSLMCGNNSIPDLGPFLENPPDDFRFDSESLATSELERIRAAWAGIPGLSAHVKDLEVLLALRRADREKLRELAAVFRGHRYLVIPKFMTWHEAKTFCEQFGGHLVVIPDKETDGFLNSLFSNGAWFWMGLYHTERGHEWVAGVPFAYSNFLDPLQERKLGPIVFGGRWTFDDVPGAHNSFIVEWDA